MNLKIKSLGTDPTAVESEASQRSPRVSADAGRGSLWMELAVVASKGLLWASVGQLQWLPGGNRTN